MNETDFRAYFAVLLLVGSVAVGTAQARVALDVPFLDLIAALLLVGPAVVVSGAIIPTVIRSLTQDRTPQESLPQ